MKKYLFPKPVRELKKGIRELRTPFRKIFDPIRKSSTFFISAILTFEKVIYQELLNEIQRCRILRKFNLHISQ